MKRSLRPGGDEENVIRIVGVGAATADVSEGREMRKRSESDDVVIREWVGRTPESEHRNRTYITHL